MLDCDSKYKGSIPLTHLDKLDFNYNNYTIWNNMITYYIYIYTHVLTYFFKSNKFFLYEIIYNKL